MTSARARRGEGVDSKADNSTNRLREWNSDKRERVKNLKLLHTSYVNGPCCFSSLHFESHKSQSKLLEKSLCSSNFPFPQLSSFFVPADRRVVSALVRKINGRLTHLSIGPTTTDQIFPIWTGRIPNIHPIPGKYSLLHLSIRPGSLECEYRESSPSCLSVQYRLWKVEWQPQAGSLLARCCLSCLRCIVKA